MNKITLNENDYELKIIEFLKEKGFVYYDQTQIFEMRKKHSEIILMDILINSIRKLNPEIEEFELNEVIGTLRRANQASVNVSNKFAHDLLINGIKVHNKEEKITKTFKVIDFENYNNNNFIVTNQFSMTSKHPQYKEQRPDIVIYLNGLPIIIFELKSPEKNNSDVILGAFQQVKNYQEYLPSLFVFNFFNVISNKHTTKMGAITSNIDRYSYWRSPMDKKKTVVSQVNEFIDMLFEKETLLNLMKNYTFFTNETNPIKIIAGYHQYYGVESATESVVKAIKSNNKENKKAGIFWHTQGSGKSYSMTMLAKNVINKEKRSTVLVVTDRSDLDEQIFQTFSKAEPFLGQSVEKISSIKHLKETLKNKVQNGIYFSTVQKFNDTVKELSDRNDILIMTDEAHRSHSNINEKYVRNEKTLEVEKKFGNAALLRKAFPNAAFIGFTGTPIEKDDFTTKSIFGDYVTKYLMSDATEDGFVVPINYESRQTKFQLQDEHMKIVDEEYADLRNEVIDNSEVASVVMKNINKRLQKFENIIGDKDRIQEISSDFIKHYRQRENVLKGKAMFVAYNREIAMKYYFEMIKQAPELKKNIRVIMTPNSQTDPSQVLEILGTKDYRRNSANEFKDSESDFKIVIVVDMWLTGFDAPSLDVIYLDKPIKMHNLMQTIARVNRVYTDKHNINLTKESGLVVDYIGIWRKLQDALAFYTDNGDELTGQKDSWTDVENIKRTLQETNEQIFNLYLDKMFIDYSKINNDSNYMYDIIEEIQQLVILKKQEELFINLVAPLSKFFKTTIATLNQEDKIKTQLLLIARSQLIKRELGKFDLDEKINSIKEKMAEAIKHNKTIIYDEIDNEKISLTKIINVLKNNSLGDKPELEAQKSHVLAQALIKEVEKINMVKAEKLSLKLNLLLNKYDGNFMTVEEFLEGIKQIAKEASKIDGEAKQMGLSPEEMAFYEILLSDEHSKNSYDKDQIKKIALEVFEKVKNKIDLTWIYNDGMKQNVRAEITESLIDNKYPPENRENIRENLISQLEQQIDRNPGFWEGKTNE